MPWAMRAAAAVVSWLNYSLAGKLTGDLAGSIAARLAGADTEVDPNALSCTMSIDFGGAQTLLQYQRLTSDLSVALAGAKELTQYQRIAATLDLAFDGTQAIRQRQRLTATLDITMDGAGDLVDTNAGFDPVSDVASATCVAWYDASDSDSITTSTGVSQWNDKSGNANHVSQGTGSKQPTVLSATQNSLDGIEFDSASSQILERTSGFTGLVSGDHPCVLLVARMPDTTSTCVDCREDASNPGFIVATDNELLTRFYYSGFTNSKADWFGQTPDSTARAWAAIFNSSHEAEFYANEDLKGTGSAGSGGLSANPAQLHIGAGEGDWQSSNMVIFELLIYDTEPSTADLAAIYDYLGAKWSVTIA